MRFFPEWWIGHAVGWPLVVGGLLLSAWAIRTMCRASVDPNPYKPTTAVVATGAYAVSRNPIYVAFALMHAGVGIWTGKLWVDAMLLPAIAIVRYGVIAPEERYLERKFGDAYIAYKNSVRRWL